MLYCYHRPERIRKAQYIQGAEVISRISRQVILMPSWYCPALFLQGPDSSWFQLFGPWGTRAGHYHEGVRMTCRKITFFTPRAPMLFAASGRGALLMMPRPLSGCQIRSRAFCWSIVCFCSSDGSFRKLKNAGGNIFYNFCHFEKSRK